MKLSLKKISFIIAIIGILILLILANISEPKLTKISDINNNYLNKNVKIHGIIKSIRNYDKIQIFVVKDNTGEIEVLVEKREKNPQNQDFHKNQTLIITGRLDQYKNGLRNNKPTLPVNLDFSELNQPVASNYSNWSNRN